MLCVVFRLKPKKKNSISVVRFPFICYAGAFFVVLVVFVVNHFHYIRISSTTHRLLSIWVLEQLQRIIFICSIQLRHCALRALNGDCIYDLIRNLNALNCACWWNSMCTYFSSMYICICTHRLFTEPIPMDGRHWRFGFSMRWSLGFYIRCSFILAFEVSIYFFCTICRYPVKWIKSWRRYDMCSVLNEIQCAVTE